MYKRCTHGGTADELCDICESRAAQYYIRSHYPEWILYRISNDSVVGSYGSRDERMIQDRIAMLTELATAWEGR